MAARLLKHHDEQTRTKIQASQLINRLTDHVLGNVEMSASQVRAAEVLLKKALPDLQAVAVAADRSGVLADILKDISGQHNGLPSDPGTDD